MLPETLVGEILLGGIGESTFGGIGVGLRGIGKHPEVESGSVVGFGRGCGAVGDPSRLFRVTPSGPEGGRLILSHESDALDLSLGLAGGEKSGRDTAPGPTVGRSAPEQRAVEFCPCAWCDREQEVTRGPGVSHGICQRHLAVMRAELAAQDWRHR